MCHPTFWLGKDCLHLQGETQAATGTSEPGPGHWVGDWVKLDLCFSSSFFCCLQSLFEGWEINHRFVLEISHYRLENKPKMPCLLRWMNRVESDFCYDASTQTHLQVLSCWIAEAWEAAAVTGSDPWGETTGRSEHPTHPWL